MIKTYSESIKLQIAFQIGTAYERMQLLEQEQKRADQLSIAGEISEQLHRMIDPETFRSNFVELVGQSLGWPRIAKCDVQRSYENDGSQ